MAYCAQDRPGADPSQAGRPGFSDVYRRPEIQAYIRDKKKSGRGCMWAVAFIPVVLLTIIGLVSWKTGEGDREIALAAFLLGLGLTVLLLVIDTFRVIHARRMKPPWEGVITRQTRKKERDRHEEKQHPDSGPSFYTLTTFYVKTDGGKEKHFGIVNRMGYANSFHIGDRVRYYPELRYIEKYDKTPDRSLYCACCEKRNPAENDICMSCSMPLFK